MRTFFIPFHNGWMFDLIPITAAHFRLHLFGSRDIYAVKFLLPLFVIGPVRVL